MKTIVSNTLCILSLCAPIVLMCAGHILYLFLAVAMFGLVVYHAKHFPKPWKRLYISFTHFIGLFLH